MTSSAIGGLTTSSQLMYMSCTQLISTLKHNILGLQLMLLVRRQCWYGNKMLPADNITVEPSWQTLWIKDTTSIIRTKFWPHFILNSCSKSGLKSLGFKCLIETFHCVYTTTVWHDMSTSFHHHHWWIQMLTKCQWFG